MKLPRTSESRNASTQQATAAPLVSDPILRSKDVEFALSVARSTVYRLVKRGELKPPLRISKNIVGWPRSVILAFIAQKVAEAPPLLERQ